MAVPRDEGLDAVRVGGVICGWRMGRRYMCDREGGMEWIHRVAVKKARWRRLRRLCR